MGRPSRPCLDLDGILFLLLRRRPEFAGQGDVIGGCDFVAFLNLIQPLDAFIDVEGHDVAKIVLESDLLWGKPPAAPALLPGTSRDEIAFI